MGIFDNKTEEEKNREKEVKQILGDRDISNEVKDVLKEFDLENDFDIVKDVYEEVKKEGINGDIPLNELINVLKERIREGMNNFDDLEIKLLKKDAEKYKSNSYELANPPRLDLFNKQIELVRKI
ncbi:hypothetical protein ALNOE001_07570 [Candidatus Methanobinarius endosymbioticus]|uniref:Uncharacterized protein n=1 Tax=Candidatus Methanobinarius endosymbioticus TaxID=2006182 RepID=A0A366MDZ9_9EURY|nr:hypothetical protein ALNOE001_07570 [Candidatus Methanobinarius endosymbioticus]